MAIGKKQHRLIAPSADGCSENSDVGIFQTRTLPMSTNRANPIESETTAWATTIGPPTSSVADYFSLFLRKANILYNDTFYLDIRLQDSIQVEVNVSLS